MLVGTLRDWELGRGGGEVEGVGVYRFAEKAERAERKEEKLLPIWNGTELMAVQQQASRGCLPIQRATSNPSSLICNANEY
ncbi:hypothetical protein RRG08_004762 [Elysia crispata]|uniref:Uncharacterized protein n=1 Tax=Elysia crispata TaxID=231223 RepID=A0AAE1AIT6_9GAST|nr:hypothetical protein RRG08_004762 [Elysia crispata]